MLNPHAAKRLWVLLGAILNEYESRFGAPLADHFGPELFCGVELGLLEQVRGRVRIKVSEPNARYATALLFVDDDTVANALQEPPPEGDGTDKEPEATPAPVSASSTKINSISPFLCPAIADAISASLAALNSEPMFSTVPFGSAADSGAVIQALPPMRAMRTRKTIPSPIGDR